MPLTRTQLQMDKQEQLQVGVNCFVAEETSSIELLTIDPKAQGRQIKQLKKFKASRDQKKVAEAIKRLQKSCGRHRKTSCPL